MEHRFCGYATSIQAGSAKIGLLYDVPGSRCLGSLIQGVFYLLEPPYLDHGHGQALNLDQYRWACCRVLASQGLAQVVKLKLLTWVKPSLAVNPVFERVARRTGLAGGGLWAAGTLGGEGLV